MVPDEVSIFNLALNAIGARSNLSTTTERDRGAEVCRLWYPVVRDQVLSAAPWPSCKAFRRLALLKNRDADKPWMETDPEPGYTFAYSAPEDMLHPRYLSDFSQFTVSSYPNSLKAINSNTREAVLTYTKRNYIVNLWEDQLQMAIAYGLAANIAMPLTGKPQRSQMLIQQANDLILTARTEGANQGMETYETMPDWITARGYASSFPTRWYYPTGSLLLNPQVK